MRGKSKNALILVLSIIMVLGSFTSVFAETPGNGKVDALVQLGLVKGDDGGLRLTDNITRAETIAMIVRMLDQEQLAESMKLIPSSFKDIQTGNWANGYVSVAVASGVVNGYPDKTFKPSNNISYAETITMLVRVLGDLTEAEKQATKYPLNYIMKGAELGVLEGIEINDYKAQATREKLFEMVYNVIVKREDAQIVGNAVEALVIENSRTSNLDENLIRLVMLAGQGKDMKWEEEDELTLDLSKFEWEGTALDRESLLGKVVNLSFDKDGNVVRITLSDSIKYVNGLVTDIEDNRIEIEDKWYSLDSDSKVKIAKRLSAIYFNSEDVKYEGSKGFMAKVKADGIDEYVRATVKNGNVLFLEAFDFEDIAPVAKIEKEKVFVLDDSTDGGSKRVTFEDEVIALEFVNGELVVADMKKLEKEDIIHWFDNDKTTVVIVLKAKNAMTEGKFKDLSYNNKNLNDIEITIDKKDINVNVDFKNRNAVFSTLNGEDTFYELTVDFDNELEAFFDEEVVVLVDIFGNLQLIRMETENTSLLGIITDVYSGEFEISTQDGKEEYYETNRSTKFYKQSGDDLVKAKLSDFGEDDLVRIVVDGDVLVRIERLSGVSEVIEKITDDIVDFGDEFKYISKRAVVFAVGNKVESMSVKDFLKIVDDTKTIKGYVVYNERDSKVAETIIITNYTRAKAATEKEVIGEVIKIRENKTGYTLTVADEDKNETAFTIKTLTDIAKIDNKEIKKGFIIKVELNKKDEVIAVNVVLGEDAPVFKVMDAGRAKKGSFVKLRDYYGDDKTVWLLSEANEFYDYEAGDYVAIGTVDAYDFIDVIQTRNTTTITGMWIDKNAIAVKAFTDELVKAPALAELVLADKAKVVNARVKYDALNVEQKSLVKKADSDLLAALEAKIVALEKAVSDKEAADKLAVANFESLLRVLPAVKDATLANEEAIVAARNAHTSLTADQKALVKAIDLDFLVALEEKMDALNKAKDDQEAVDNFVTELEKLPLVDEIKVEDEDAVKAVRDIHTALTEDQKALVEKADLDKLVELELKIEELKG